MNKFKISVLTLFFAFSCDAVELMQTHFETPDVVLAEEVLSAPDRHVRDFSKEIQNAIDRVAARGGGTLFLQAGHYNLDQPIIVKEGVTLRGDYPDKISECGRGTVLCITDRKGVDSTAATITVQRGSGVRGLTFWYPEQRWERPQPYPWTISAAKMEKNDNQSIFDCIIVNGWNGIRIGPQSNELHTLRRLKICALNNALFIDSTTDIGRLSELLISPQVWLESGLPRVPSGDDAQRFRDLLRNGSSVGVNFGRSDWEYIWRLRVNGYNRGVVFQKGKRGKTNAVMGDSDISGCFVALCIDTVSKVGLSLYNCRLNSNDVSVLGTGNFDTITQFHSCRLDNRVENLGKGVFSFKNCRLHNVMIESGELLMADSTFNDLTLAEDVQRVRVVGFDPRSGRLNNRTRGGDIMISPASLNQQPQQALIAPEPAPFRAPGTTRVIDVTHFGASSELDDNAVAFQRALDAAGKGEDGATVYVPAGFYRFKDDIRVPSGVELRGCFDVPHHTISDGSVLMPCHNAGDQDASAFVRLSAGSGLRGLSFWYPMQSVRDPQPYPWCVQSLGAGCWIIDTNIGNAWWGVDFATHPSEGHVVQYLSGAMFQRGLFVGNGAGWVEDVQFNPHYMGRHSSRVAFELWPGEKYNPQVLIEYQRRYLKGIIFENCLGERVRGNFLYAGHEGITFKGECVAEVLIHGSDTVSRAAYLDMDSGSQARFALAQLVSLGDYMEGAIVASDANRGAAVFMNSQIWAGNSTALLNGFGRIKLEQFNTCSGVLKANSGEVIAELGFFSNALEQQIMSDDAVRLSVLACINKFGLLRVQGGGQLSMSANSITLRHDVADFDSAASVHFKSSFEDNKVTVPLRKIATPGGGIRSVIESCTVVGHHPEAHRGRRVVRFSGVAESREHSFVYHVIYDQPILLPPDARLVYWKKPLNKLGCATAVDLFLRGGEVLRSLPCGHGNHPGARKGDPQEWKRISIPLESLSGKVVEKIMIAFDTRGVAGKFDVLFDDIEIGSPLPLSVWSVRARPAGDAFASAPLVTIEHAPELRVRYTLNGTNPTMDDRVYHKPFKIPLKTTTELRYSPFIEGAQWDAPVFGEIYRARTD
jgi:hypothetical protein